MTMARTTLQDGRPNRLRFRKCKGQQPHVTLREVLRLELNTLGKDHATLSKPQQEAKTCLTALRNRCLGSLVKVPRMDWFKNTCSTTSGKDPPADKRNQIRHSTLTTSMHHHSNRSSTTSLTTRKEADPGLTFSIRDPMRTQCFIMEPEPDCKDPHRDIKILLRTSGYICPMTNVHLSSITISLMATQMKTQTTKMMPLKLVSLMPTRKACTTTTSSKMMIRLALTNNINNRAIGECREAAILTEEYHPGLQCRMDKMSTRRRLSLQGKTRTVSS